MTFNRLALVSCLLLPVSNVQAAAIGISSMSIDWSTMSLSGAAMTSSSITLPSELGGGTVSSGADARLEYGQPYNEQSDGADDGASTSTSYSNPPLADMSAEFNATSGMTTVSVSINNSTDPDKYGQAFSYRGFIYEATEDGTVTFDVDYSFSGNVSVGDMDEYSSGNFRYLMEAGDVTTYLSVFNSEYASNGGDADAAEEAADAASQIGFLEVDLGFTDAFLNCTPGLNCTPAMNGSGTMSLSFDVFSGEKYMFGTEAEVGVWTQINAVPVPAAVWLFGSGLIGLVGIARRKKA